LFSILRTRGSRFMNYNFLQFAVDGKNNSKTKVEKVFFFIFMSSYAELSFLKQKSLNRVKKFFLNRSIWGLPQKIKLFGSNFWSELDTKIKSPILKSFFWTPYRPISNKKFWLTLFSDFLFLKTHSCIGRHENKEKHLLYLSLRIVFPINCKLLEIENPKKSKNRLPLLRTLASIQHLLWCCNAASLNAVPVPSV
jgi:hypothetical protein